MIVIAPVALFIILIDMMTRYAYDRKSINYPKSLTNMILGNKKKKGSHGNARELAEALQERADQRVEIEGYEGIQLVGHYYPCSDHKRVLIACHGWHSSCFYEYRTIAPFLHDHDTSVLLLDLRAHGESGGRYVYYGKKERFDLVRWADYVAKTLAPGVPIYLMGMSEGSFGVLMSTTAGLNDQVKGVIADSCAGSAREIGMRVVKNMHLPAKLIYPCVRLDARVRTGMDDNEYTVYEAVQENQIPVLFIHGSEDEVTELKYMEKVYDLCVAPKQKLIVEGAGHTKSCFVQPELYEQSLLHFFAQCETNR